jgi:Tat protein secretion system quality control protein TatD with DNase activity
MTDAHCHVSCGDSSVRELLIGRDFFGIHPWEILDETTGTSRALVPDVPVVPGVPFLTALLASLRPKLLANPNAGVGEIGLDRLKVRDIPPLMREVFEAQLSLAVELGRPVVLHGAKCWGQVVATVKRMMGGGLATRDTRQAFLFHGFSRSDGLIPEIVKLNGFISVGPAILNDHAVNYRELVKKIPLDRLLVETDAVAEVRVPTRPPETDAMVGARVPTRPHIRDVLAKTADILNLSSAELERITDENANRFLCVV